MGSVCPYVLKRRFYCSSGLGRPTVGKHRQLVAVPTRRGRARPAGTTRGSTGGRGQRRDGRAGAKAFLVGSVGRKEQGRVSRRGRSRVSA